MSYLHDPAHCTCHTNPAINCAYHAQNRLDPHYSQSGWQQPLTHEFYGFPNGGVTSDSALAALQEVRSLAVAFKDFAAKVEKFLYHAAVTGKQGGL